MIKTREFALLEMFAEPRLDEETHMWWVDLEQFSLRQVVELYSLSAPLVIAKEEQRLWFLLLLYILDHDCLFIISFVFTCTLYTVKTDSIQLK